MTWTSLKNALKNKPMVLAGPILRKVTKDSVTVWVATQAAAKVELFVMSGSGAPAAMGEGNTVAVGENLHIVAVTARPGSAGRLVEGVVYEYNLRFKFKNETLDLIDAIRDPVDPTRTVNLCYGSMVRPSFALPPADQNHLRILQGSCRMPHAEGKDALPMIDALIEASATNAYARPHQLLLTGDQIYADDVAEALLIVLSDAAEALLGWDEVLPFPNTFGGPVVASKLPPACLRRPVLSESGFTSHDLGSHVMSLGEYLCMYLFVWSDALWPATLPSYADVAARVHAVVPPKELHIHEDFIDFASKGKIEARTQSVAEFAKRDELQKVRRALANVPCYMMFDDHEITDDWNTTRRWCRNFYGNDLGLRIAQNGLAAYALCQHWGNVPEQFDQSSQPGRILLELLDTRPPAVFSQKAASYSANSASIRSLLGVQAESALAQRAHNAVFHDPFSLRYNFAIESDGHVVIFTDTRTWRSFPKGGGGPPVLLPKAQLTEQIVNAPQAGERALLVVLSTNAPAVQPIRAAARRPSVSRFAAGVAKNDFCPDVYEAWEIPSEQFDQLMTALTTQLPAQAGGRRWGRIILLSGDVHHSFATRVVYRANERYGDAKPGLATSAVVAQLVTSSFKKEDSDTRGFQRDGYTYGPGIVHGLGYIPPHQPEGYAGWNVPPNSKLVVGEETWNTPKVVFGVTYYEPVKIPCELTQPTKAIQIHDAPIPPINTRTIRFTRTPDYVYRLDYLVPEKLGTPGPLPSLPPLGPSASNQDRKLSAQTFRTGNTHYRMQTDKDPKIIGVNNVGEITFNWGPGDAKAVNHTLHWRKKGVQTWTTYLVNLDPKHPTEIPDYDGPTPP